MECNIERCVVGGKSHRLWSSPLQLFKPRARDDSIHHLSARINAFTIINLSRQPCPKTMRLGLSLGRILQPVIGAWSPSQMSRRMPMTVMLYHWPVPASRDDYTSRTSCRRRTRGCSSLAVFSISQPYFPARSSPCLCTPSVGVSLLLFSHQPWATTSTSETDCRSCGCRSFSSVLLSLHRVGFCLRSSVGGWLRSRGRWWWFRSRW